MSYLAHLYPHLRIHQVFGANTDVGKTIFTTALALASVSFPLDATSVKAAAIDQRGYPTQHKHGESAYYIKPVSTGHSQDADNLHINRFSPATNAHTLYQFEEPISPHLAAARSSQPTPSDSQVVQSISERLTGFSKDGVGASVAYLETAGGVHSPAPSGSSMASLLRPLRLPTILIGDSQLGGISTTKSAYDSLILAGHDVQALLLFSDASRGLGNAEYLMKWGKEVDLPVWGLAGQTDDGRWGTPPSRATNRQEDERRMHDFYRGLVFGRGQEAERDESQTGMLQVVQYLRSTHLKRIENLDTMASRTLESCWWPFTQHTLAKTQADVNVIDSAHGDFFTIYKPGSSETLIERTLDGSASWWTQCLGHGDTSLTYAAARAAARYGHVLFPMCSNEPSLLLSETLLGRETGLECVTETAPGYGWASKVFFSDDGSTGMEVALKMAISSSAARYSPRAKAETTKKIVEKGRKAGYQGGRPTREWKVLGLKGSYHGDTIGAMDACEGSVFNKRVHWYRGRGDWLEPPVVSIKEGKVIVELPLHDDDWRPLRRNDQSKEYSTVGHVYDVEQRVKTDPLYSTYVEFIRAWLDRLTGEEGNLYGALVLEPLVMGAGGMIFVDPLFQRSLVDVVRNNEELFTRVDPPLKRQSHLVMRTKEGQWKGLPIIFDEVFTGLYRLGFPTPALPLGIRPDISVLAKILTGGMVPMSVTLASQSIFDTFSQSDQKVDALLHGHSYTAHPIGCEIARETLKKIEGMRKTGAWSEEKLDWNKESKVGEGEVGQRNSNNNDNNNDPWSFWKHEAVMELSKMERVNKVMALGTVLALEVKDKEGTGGYSSTASVDLLKVLRNSPDGPFTIHARPLGNVVYFMCSLNTPADVRRKTEKALHSALL
ncbi:hypothetical protein CBS101457_005238 [Exobasidium rhododendri]|nr:hypothetical protein CBS101457_005238 [Exobasidium rhododendri]